MNHSQGAEAMITIRAAVPEDLAALYAVCLLTGDAGGDASAQYRDPRLLGAVNVGPYVMLPSGVGFAVADDQGVAGYVLGAADTRTFEADCEVAWWPSLRARYPDPGPDPGDADAQIAALIHRPHLASDAVADEYPAHLHIDLLPRVQGRGLGRELMDLMLATLHAAGAPGAHLPVALRNERAIGFYRHLGFAEVERGEHALIMGRSTAAPNA